MDIIFKTSDNPYPLNFASCISYPASTHNLIQIIRIRMYIKRIVYVFKIRIQIGGEQKIFSITFTSKVITYILELFFLRKHNGIN